MPDYRKKKHSKIISSPKPRKQKTANREGVNSDIKMSSAQKYHKTTVSQNMKVVKGKKQEQRRKLQVFTAIIAVILIIFGILQLALPMGLIESISHTVSLFGTGSYPIELESTQTIDAQGKGSHYYVLSNSQLYAVSPSGKILFSYSHGFENPILKTSNTRALLFEQNGTRAYIFTLGGLKKTVDTEKSILTAGISASGAYAIACRSDKYASDVSVYKKSGKRVYEWFSAENTVNNIALSKNGKKLAVSAFSAKDGQYKSVLSVLNFKSATPEYTEDLSGRMVYSLDNTHGSYFAVVSENAIEFIKWSNFKKKQYKNDYSVSLLRPQKSGYVAVFNRKTDKTDNRLAVFSRSGELKYEFTHKGIISDVALSGNNVYCMSETDLYLFSDDGKILRKASCGFGAVRISVTASNTVAVITDNKIDKVKLEQVAEK